MGAIFRGGRSGLYLLGDMSIVFVQVVIQEFFNSLLLDILKFDQFFFKIRNFFSVIPFLCPYPKMLITKFRLCRLCRTCTWNCPVDDIKSPGTFWLSLKFTFFFWSKSMCIRENFSEVGFFFLEGLFSIVTYLQLNSKTAQIPGLWP